jgi:hypothetical protein
LLGNCPALAPAQAEAYILSADGAEATDPRTGLIWRRCIEGMAWNGQACAGQPLGLMWQESLLRAEDEARRTGQAWRLPNIKELTSLVNRSGQDLAIDTQTFPPAFNNDQFWSSTPYAQDAFFGWVVHFYYGASYYTYLEDLGRARLVRDAR